MTRYASLALALCAAALAACDKNGRQDITAPAVGAYVKFSNFSVGSPGVNFYANSAKITAVGSTACQPPNDTTSVCKTTGTESTTGTAYNGFGNAALYNDITPGQVTLAGKIAAATDNGLAVATVSTTLDNAKYYSYYMSGVYDATNKKADAFVIEDDFPATIDYTVTYVRFVNAISNSSPMTLYAKSSVTGTESAIGGSTAYKAATAFVAIPPAVYDLNTRNTGSTTNVITRTAVSFVAGHVYTITARGIIGSTTSAPALDNTANR